MAALPANIRWLCEYSDTIDINLKQDGPVWRVTITTDTGTHEAEAECPADALQRAIYEVVS